MRARIGGSDVRILNVFRTHTKNTHTQTHTSNCLQINNQRFGSSALPCVHVHVHVHICSIWVTSRASQGASLFTDRRHRRHAATGSATAKHTTSIAQSESAGTVSDAR